MFLFWREIEDEREQTTAENVAESDGNQIMKKSRDVECFTGEKSGWNVEHVGNTVFKAAHNKESNWKDTGEKFAEGGFGAKSHENS